jgi:hypothetical protein
LLSECRFAPIWETEFLAAFDLAPQIAARVRGGRRIEGFKGTADLPNQFRRPFGAAALPG